MPLIPYFKLATYALAVIVGFGCGWKVNGWRKDSAIHAMQEQAQTARDEALANIKALEAAQDARIAIAAALEVERNKAAQIVTKEVVRDVIKYVQKPSSQSVCLDSDGVRLINASAAGRMSPESDTAAAANATAAAVVASVTDNYATCNTNSNQLMALQDWVRALQ